MRFKLKKHKKNIISLKQTMTIIKIYFKIFKPIIANKNKFLMD